eukprot:1062693-Prorocentrum_minimum.AAC.1
MNEVFCLANRMTPAVTSEIADMDSNACMNVAIRKELKRFGGDEHSALGHDYGDSDGFHQTAFSCRIDTI